MKTRRILVAINYGVILIVVCVSSLLVADAHSRAVQLQERAECAENQNKIFKALSYYVGCDEAYPFYIIEAGSGTNPENKIKNAIVPLAGNGDGAGSLSGLLLDVSQPVK